MPPARIRAVNVAKRRLALADWIVVVLWKCPLHVEEISLVSARDRATGEMSVVACREIAIWSFRPSCEWLGRRSLPNKMSLEAARVIFILGYLRQTFVRRGPPRKLWMIPRKLVLCN